MTLKNQSRLPAILGCLTLLGLILVLVGSCADGTTDPYPLPFVLQCVGAFLLVAAGTPWAHTRGWRVLKAFLLGAIGFGCGGAAGLFLGLAIDSGAKWDLGTGILLVVGGFWLGAVVGASLGLWWGLHFHRRYRPVEPAAP